LGIRASAMLRSCVTATALSRFERFTEPSANGRYLRTADGRSGSGPRSHLVSIGTPDRDDVGSPAESASNRSATNCRGNRCLGAVARLPEWRLALMLR
jgi:hypothetical protein